eukprot:TRINITY_DN2495_c0_g2_i1.p1 TRINITY_DN2495_c0_g2~~TRINITY_DN2495_c0_g2_i1.p1  ORF type:complete len:603 (-),score=152.68 TRINITY_DN2495_c0_g2_i1:1234-3042(-)
MEENWYTSSEDDDEFETPKTEIKQIDETPNDVQKETNQKLPPPINEKDKYKNLAVANRLFGVHESTDDNHNIPTPPLSKQNQREKISFASEFEQIEAIPMLSNNRWDIETGDNLRPEKFIETELLPKYHAIIIGGGLAGLEIAEYLCSFDHKILLIEKNFIGGNNFLSNVFPTKTFSKYSKTDRFISQCQKFGIETEKIQEEDFSTVMNIIRMKRAEISRQYSLETLVARGLHLIFGEGKFVSKKEFSFQDKVIKFEHAFICTGSSPFIPDIPGLLSSGFVTYQSFWNLEVLPKRIAFLGAGLTGLEFAEALARFGSQIIIIEKQDRILNSFDKDASKFVYNLLMELGVKFHFNQEIVSIDNEAGECILNLKSNDVIRTDMIFLSCGNNPNTSNLGLELADVDVHNKHIVCKNNGKTTNKRIYAVGDCADCCHALGSLTKDYARAAAQDSRAKTVCQIPEYITKTCNTSPAVACVGLTEQQLKKDEIPYDVIITDFASNTRALMEGMSDGYIKILLKSESEELLGVTIIHEKASELIAELAIMVNHKMELRTLANVAHTTTSLSTNLVDLATRHLTRLKLKKHSEEYAKNNHKHTRETVAFV